MTRTLISCLFSFALVACGGKDDGDTADTSGGTGTGTGTGTADAATCADYCATYMATCVDANATYADEAECNSTCAGFPQGEPGATSGDSLECRAYHAGAAGTDADTHCPHASADGGGVCV